MTIYSGTWTAKDVPPYDEVVRYRVEYHLTKSPAASGINFISIEEEEVAGVWKDARAEIKQFVHSEHGLAILFAYANEHKT